MFRAWFTLPDHLLGRDGEPINALLGFTDFVGELFVRTGAERIAFAFDQSLASSFRNEIYPSYKANRPPAPESLKRQFRQCRTFLGLLGIREYGSDRYEADDLIGALSVHARDLGHRVTLVTADKDLTQLVTDTDDWWDFAKDRRMGPRQIEQRFGVRPEQIADCLALAGDAIDNIPGVPGVGMATAAKLLRRFGSIDALLGDTPAIARMQIRGAKRLQELIEAHSETIRLARRLTVIECSVDMSRPRDFGVVPVESEPLRDWMNQTGFGAHRQQRWLEWLASRQGPR